MTLKIYRKIFLLLLFPSMVYSGEPAAKKISAERLSQGPLKISADETVSREHGKIIEASGHVQVNYLMENGDTLQSSSQFARYDRGEGLGEIWGDPDALWISKDGSQPPTRLLAHKIAVKPAESELKATGKVSVLQSSSTLSAETVSYSNEEKKITAMGERPEFSIRQDDHETRISSQKIIAFMDKKEIHFMGQVQGTVILKKAP